MGAYPVELSLPRVGLFHQPVKYSTRQTFSHKTIHMQVSCTVEGWVTAVGSSYTCRNTPNEHSDSDGEKQLANCVSLCFCCTDVQTLHCLVTKVLMFTSDTNFPFSIVGRSQKMERVSFLTPWLDGLLLSLCE
jgi:hypothetical protein